VLFPTMLNTSHVAILIARLGGRIREFPYAEYGVRRRHGGSTAVDEPPNDVRSLTSVTAGSRWPMLLRPGRGSRVGPVSTTAPVAPISLLTDDTDTPRSGDGVGGGAMSGRDGLGSNPYLFHVGLLQLGVIRCRVCGSDRDEPFNS
jgi:hypothetical protein